MKAAEFLEDGDTSRLSTGEYRRLVLLATGSTAEAEERARRRMAARMRAGLPVD